MQPRSYLSSVLSLILGEEMFYLVSIWVKEGLTKHLNRQKGHITLSCL